MPSTQTPIPLAVPPPNMQAVQSPEWLYDEIMRFIEPDLMLDAIPRLTERYKDETAEERAARMGAYDRAFAAYDQVYAKVADDLMSQAQRLRKQAQASVAVQEEAEQSHDLSDAESQLDQAA